MTLYEFNTLSRNAQVDYWTWESRYLAQRREDGYKVVLYALDSFFVEACYDPVTIELFWLRSFSSIKLLDSYLDQIQFVLP